ncbi:hypothetical protein SCP_0900920 [Sparassis crispa]|uniref:AB hydrolase-1 domain-containing protein n=1 Tax=Sparassis crispa TaxID=139825 RepID=A0A401GVK2_9APHY|nr:hypothetical protein SCP_0900920 [Sparassis crispa]GBE86213.1 hypothetical protein SCP_0900920 [Sparassis crispa]
MPTLNCQAYICDPRPNYPLFITAKRYWLSEADVSGDPAEPTIEELYDNGGREGKPRIREAWSIDSPNAGAAAVLNEKTLLHGYSVFDCQEYVRAVHIFLTGLGTGVDVDFSTHNIEYGLRDLPTAYYPDKKDGVTLKCSKVQEIATYMEELGSRRAYDFLPTLCATMPVHFIYGTIDDFLPRAVQDYVLNVCAKGEYTSARRVEGAGHMVPQMQPKRLADAIWDILAHDPVLRSANKSLSRL